MVERMCLCSLHQNINSRSRVQEIKCKHFYAVRVVGRRKGGLESSSGWCLKTRELVLPQVGA